MADELIDTLWNVNKSWAPFAAMEKRELIDTLWNVNDSGGFPFS